MDFGHLGFDSVSNNGGPVSEISKQRFGLQKQNDDDLRDFKISKTDAMLRFPLHRYSSASEGHQQMLSFSSPYSQPLNLPFYPHAFARNSGGINMQQQQQGLRGLFTASQWMELEHQALIYKYITANVPIPSYLLNPIRKAFESAGFPVLRSNPLGWGGFQLGFSNTDPEPGRCRRTDGKKWRCSRDAVADQKYCERHMNRGRHRSRKPVEPQPGHSATATSAPVVGVSGNTPSHHLPNLQPTPTSAIPTLSRSVVDANRAYQQHTTLVSMTSPKVCLQDKHQNTTTSQESSFGIVCSDSLLNPLNSSSSSLVNSDNNNKSQHPLRQFMDDWPKTHLSISIPMPTSDFMSSTSSPTAVSPHQELEMGLSVGRVNPRQTDWVPISWEPSMGGPLGEVLHTSTGECKNKPLNLWDNGPRLATSPTGVLQRGAFVSLSNSSTASSPRAESGLMNPALPPL